MEVAAAGIDTWSVCWYLDRDSAKYRFMDELASLSAGRGRLLPDPIDGHRWGFYPESGMVYAEGHPVEGGLAPASVLSDRLQSLRSSMSDYGLSLPEGPRRHRLIGGDPEWGDYVPEGEGFGGVRRLDVTANLRTDPMIGRAFMRGSLELLTVASPNGQRIVPHFKGGHLETVALHGSTAMLGRVYDKGVESGSAPRYTLPRLEAQDRYKSGHRPAMKWVTGEYLAHVFTRRFKALWAKEGVIVSDPIRFAQKVHDELQKGNVTLAQAERLVGYQLLRTAAGDRAVANPRTDHRRRSEIAETGLVLAPVGEDEDVEISLSDLHEQLADAALWQG